jgi:hypothetical protein
LRANAPANLQANHIKASAARNQQIAFQVQRTLYRSHSARLHYESQKCESPATRGAEFVDRWLRISYDSDQLHIATDGFAQRSAEIGRVVGREIYLTKIAQNGAGTENLDLCVFVLTAGELAEFVWVMSTIVAWRDLARFEKRVAERAVRFRHAMMRVAV